MSTGYYNLVGADYDEKLLENNEEYRRIIGMVLYLSVNSRPDISASISILSQKVSKSREIDMVELKRLIKYLKGTRHYKLKMNSGNNEYLEIYSDADWAEDRNDRKSNSGYLCKANGGTISWCCRKQNMVAMSSTEAEYIALAETCKEAMWMRKIL